MMEDTPITPALAAEERPRLKFGTKPHQVIPFEWAERGLCYLYEHQQKAFSDMMLAVMDTSFKATEISKKTANGRPS